MIYGSLWAEFMKTKHSGHKIPIFGKTVVYLPKTIINNN